MKVSRKFLWNFSKLKIMLAFGLSMVLMLSASLHANAEKADGQQKKTVSGTVVDAEDNVPVIGATVSVQGTTNGTVTNIDGEFSLSVNPTDVLVFSFIGYKTQTIPVGDQTTFNVTLQQDVTDLDEVVVVGYGVQKKKLVTGATVQVDGDNLQKMNTTSALGALQTQSPGVNITQVSGQPGDGFKVTIRGLGTVGNASPLYVIDGVAGGDINSLNPSDIESVDVLKDAASAAIYGARAANGVILVTTKKGTKGKMRISYDGYYGVQYLAKMPSILNAQESIAMSNEIRFNEGRNFQDWEGLLPPDLYSSITDGSWEGTNWLEESYNEAAPTQNHAINLYGGNDQSVFSIGFSYSAQEGILGKPVQSDYERYTARINSDHVLFEKGGMDIIKIGETLNFNTNTRSGIATGNIYWNSIYDLLVATPLLPAYDNEGNFYDYYDKQDNDWNLDGNAGNPLAQMAMSSRGLNESVNYGLQTSAYLEIQPIKNLIIKSQFGYKMSASRYRSYDAIRRLSNTVNVTMDAVSQSGSSGHNITLDNTIAYSFDIDETHEFSAVIGQSIEKWGMGANISSGGSNTIFPGLFDYAWVDNSKPTELSQRSAGGSPWGEGGLASFFGRINYNFNETYLFSAVMRADGSSNFSKGNRWGYFPSVSAGWVMTNENFLETTSNWLDFFKLRASWGQNGNSSIANFQYLSTISFDESNGYYFASDKKTQTVGGYADILANPDVTWETSEQLNIGFDARFLNSRLGLTFDWYTKTTKDWLVTAPISAVWGLNPPSVNGGDVENKGIEIAFTWNDNIGDFNYNIGVNMSHNKNEVTHIANAEGIIHGNINVLAQGTSEMYRAQEGYPIGYFYGYKTDGVFQNWEQVESTDARYAGAEPGDLIFVDTNNDGEITEDDRTMIGNPHPDYIMGLNINMSYKGLDFAVNGVGAFGHQIALYDRYTTKIFDRWTGEGTSNTMPRLTSTSHTNWQNISEMYFEDGDYFKVKNITIGYDFKTILPNVPLEQMRLYFSAQNLITFTNYSGMDPEVGYGYDGGNNDGHENWSSGIDLGYYPSPRTLMVGVNLKF
nr:TonB-dependent receptor [uncultured Draconibacterium sp.]